MRLATNNSPFKTQFEYYNIALTTSTNNAQLSSKSVNGKETMGFLLSPGRGGANDRNLIGSKGRFKGINIKGSIDNDLNIPITVRLSVVELIEAKDPLKNTTAFPQIDWGAFVLLDTYFKNADFAQDSHSYQPFYDIENYKRIHTPINIGEIKVLKQQYVSLGGSPGGTANDNQLQGFHFYIPMDREIDKDDFVVCAEHKQDPSSTLTNAAVRYSYAQPILLLVEWLCRPADDIPTAGQKLCNIAWTAKYTFKDSS